MAIKSTLGENIILLQSYYKFLYLGKFLEKEIKNRDFSSSVTDIKAETGAKSYFMIRGDMIKHILQSIHKHPDKKNIFGYLIEISAFRGVLGTTKELIDSEFAFQRYLRTTLGKQFFPFEQIIKFIRNVLSHSTTSHVRIKTDDFIKQKDYLKKNVDTLVDFKFVYADIFPQWKGSKDYGIRIQLDFKKMKDGQSMFDLISLHQLYLLTELCFNLSEIFRISMVRKPPSKFKPRHTKKK